MLKQWPNTVCQLQTVLAKKYCFSTGTVLKPQTLSRVDNESSSNPEPTLPCLACKRNNVADSYSFTHNMRSCLVWEGLSHQERVSLVKCVKHPFAKDNHTTSECRRSIGSCIYCLKQNDHNSMLCPNFRVKKKTTHCFSSQ